MDRLAAAPAIQAVQMVYIFALNELHRDQVLAAAGAGKHVLCEKPVANAGEGARETVAALDTVRSVIDRMVLNPMESGGSRSRWNGISRRC